jgi:hypothetical protein
MNLSTDFDLLNKRKDWNALPDRKPSPEAIEDLKTPYLQQIEDVRQRMRSMMKSNDFQPKVKGVQTFSHRSYFDTVMLDGDQPAKAKELKQKEVDDFNKKLVVDNPKFLVNTTRKPERANIMDKFKNILDDPVAK